jgi:hypothetical protein
MMTDKFVILKVAARIKHAGSDLISSSYSTLKRAVDYSACAFCDWALHTSYFSAIAFGLSFA